jgi:hypothetical protein
LRSVSTFSVYVLTHRRTQVALEYLQTEPPFE